VSQPDHAPTQVIAAHIRLGQPPGRKQVTDCGAGVTALTGARAVGFWREEQLATDQQGVEALGGRQVVEPDDAVPWPPLVPPLVKRAQQPMPALWLAAELGQFRGAAPHRGAQLPPVVIISPAREVSPERFSSVFLVKGHCGHRSFSYEGEQGRLVPAGNGLRRYVP